MAGKQRPGLDLEIDDRTQHREFRIQRFAWVVLALVLLATLAGLTGDGPLANAHAERGGVRLEWARIVRAKAETQLRLQAPATLARDGLLAVRLNRRWAEDMDIESVQPEAERVSTGDDFVEYLFAVPPGATTTSATFTVRPQGLGRRELTVAAADAPTFNVRQFVLP